VSWPPARRCSCSAPPAPPDGSPPSWRPAAGPAAAYDDLLRQVAAGEISLDVDPEPLAKVEQVWPRAGSDRRVVFVP
jgi:hypothetical protein